MPPSLVGPPNVPMLIAPQEMLIYKNCGVTIPKISAAVSDALKGRTSGSLALPQGTGMKGPWR